MVVSAAALRASAIRARAASQRAIRLLRDVLRHLVLLPRRVDLRPALVVLALRHDLLIEQRTNSP